MTVSVAGSAHDFRQTSFSTAPSVDEFQHPAQAAGLRFHVPPVRLHVHSDPLLLELILRNLISNAIKYTPAGSVSTVTRVEDGHVVLKLTDTRVG